jgi:hypothetical protein
MSTSTQVIVLTECPRGHERELTVNEDTPERWWTLTCPLCAAEHQLLLPEIVAAEP